MPSYISVTQARTARFHSQETHPNIRGLYTDNFSECNIFVFKKKYEDHTRISLTHADRIFSTKFFQDELTWVGLDCEKIIFRKKNNAFAEQVTEIILTSMPEDIVEDFQIHEVEDRCFGIGVDCESFQEFSKDSIPDLACHPLEWLFHNTYILNSLLDTETFFETPNHPLIFDATNWIDVANSHTKAKPNSVKFLSLYKTLIEQYSIHCITNTRLITQKLLHDYFPKLYNIAGISMICFATEVLQKQNDFKALFTKEIEYLNQNLDLSLLNRQQRQLFSDVLELMTINFNQALYYISQHKSELGDTPSLKNILAMASLCNRLQKHSSSFSFNPSQPIEHCGLQDDEKSPNP